MTGLFFIRLRRARSTVVPHVFQIEDGGETKTKPTVTTMADSVRPLLTSMKLFGLYFRCKTEAGIELASETSCRHWNGCMIYGVVMAIVMWINVARMFSVFKNELSKCLFPGCDRYFSKLL